MQGGWERLEDKNKCEINMQQIKMADVSSKPMQKRTARACGTIYLVPATILAIKNQNLAKGDVLAVAKIAGIQAAKDTARLIPLCHPLILDWVDIDLEFSDNAIVARSAVIADERTDVEMEALTAVSVTLLTIYDMCKPIDKNMKIGDIFLVSKEKANGGN